MNIEYDSIAHEYKGVISSQSSVFKDVEESTFLALIGNVEGKTVLDLGCGEGRFSRKIKQMGAYRVVGVDISKEMVELARIAEKKNALDIEYIVEDAIKLGQIGLFDLVIAAFLFPFAPSKEALLAMCKTSHDNLKSGGKLLALINGTPLYLPKNSNATQKYGYLIESPSPLQEGDILKYTLFTEGNSLITTHYHWSKETYDFALRESGFSDVRWQLPVISEEDLEKYGVEFWQDYLQNPNFVGIECLK